MRVCVCVCVHQVFLNDRNSREMVRHIGLNYFTRYEKSFINPPQTYIHTHTLLFFQLISRNTYTHTHTHANAKQWGQAKKLISEVTHKNPLPTHRNDPIRPHTYTYTSVHPYTHTYTSIHPPTHKWIDEDTPKIDKLKPLSSIFVKRKNFSSFLLIVISRLFSIFPTFRLYMTIFQFR